MVWMILVNMQNIKIIGFSTFRDMMSQKVLLQKRTGHRDSVITNWNPAKLEKIILPSAFPWFSSKTKNFICSIFQDVSFQKQLQQPLW